MARVDNRLREGTRCTEEGCLGKYKVHCVNTACICRRIYLPNSLIEQKEEESNEASERIVGRETLCALIPIIDEHLEGKRATKEKRVGDSAYPRHRSE